MIKTTVFILISLLGTVATTVHSQEIPGPSSNEILKKANHYFETRRYDSSLVWYKEYLSQQDPGLNPGQENTAARVSMQIGNICMLEGNSSPAETAYKTALDLAGEWNCLKAEIYQNLGSLYFVKEHYEYAILHYQKSLFLYSHECSENPGRMFDLLTSLGTAYSGNGEFQNSLSCFHQADSILKNVTKQDPLRRAGLNINIGGILIRMNAPEKALSFYRAAGKFNLTNSITEKSIRISANEGMAGCYSLLGKPDSAMECLERCLDLMKLTGVNMKNDSSRIYLKMGDIQSRQQEWDASMIFYHKAMAILIPESAKPLFDEEQLKLFEADLLDVYRIYEHMGKNQLQCAISRGYDTLCLSQSYSSFVTALKISEHISQDFGQGISRMIFQESTKSILSGAMESGFLLREKQGVPRYDDLFFLSDENTHRMLLEDMEENRSLSFSGSPDSIIHKIRGLKDEIVRSSRRYITEDPCFRATHLSSLDDLQNKVIDLRMKLDSMRKTIRQNYSLPSSLIRKEQMTTPALIMKSLKKDEAMLEYLWADSVVYLFLVRSDGLSMQRIVISPEFTVCLKECLHQLKGAGIQNFSSLSHTLYRYLIAPAESQLKGIRRLIIIPDEELSLFPFETLIREDTVANSDPDTRTWHYLIRDFEVIYHFSGKAWLKDTITANLIPAAYSFAGFAPGFRDRGTAMESGSPLPNTIQEVTGISGLFGLTKSNQSAFIDTSATEINFRSHISGFSHFHIATHSLISEKDPMNSALLFSAGDHSVNPQGDNDGLLHLDEIGNLQMDASLVVLSACATGEGKVTHTEGVLALTRGFYLAGASNVIYSLWNIPDQITCSLMLRFYRSYLSGKTYSAALREVKLKMISRAETSLPYLWAGFVVLGK